MAVASKAYILKINTPISQEYAKNCADSCDEVGLKWEYFQGYQNMTGRAAWCLTGISMNFHEPVQYLPDPNPAQKANACSAGHGAIWKKIADGPDEAAIILEHDAIMLQPCNIGIPDNIIAVLGYKITDPQNYNHKVAGEPKELISIDGHEGAHAYAMTKTTAKFLVNEIEQRGILGAVDNAYFIRGQRKTRIPLKIVSPTAALGWLRESTIWGSSANRNYEFITTFKENYK